MAEYKALTYINLPLLDIKKAPGDTITTEEFTTGGQTEEDISALLEGGSISEDSSTPLHPDHVSTTAPAPSDPDAQHVVASDEGKGVTNA
jgi:hypothetical protein